MHKFLMKRIFHSFSVACGLFLTLSACSVYKASSNEGVDVHDIEHCRKKSCLLSHGMQRIDKKEVNGKLIELYRARRKKSDGNCIRAAGHGFLDVCTLGLWEVAGTPIENSIDDDRGYLIIQVTSKDESCDEFEKMEIYDKYGQMVKTKNNN